MSADNVFKPAVAVVSTTQTATTAVTENKKPGAFERNKLGGTIFRKKSKNKAPPSLQKEYECYTLC